VQPSVQSAQLVGVFDRIAQRRYNDALNHVESRKMLSKIVVGFCCNVCRFAPGPDFAT
jgi:hypothetical protein